MCVPLWRVDVNVVLKAFGIGTYECEYSEAVAPCLQGIFRVDILIRLWSLKVRLRRCFCLVHFD